MRARDVVDTVKQIVREAVADDLLGEAAKAAFNFFLALFPLILVVFALTGIVGGAAAFTAIMDRLQASAPADAANYLGRFIREITLTKQPGVLSIGLLLTLWSASGIFTALASGLNAMYGVRERRPWWRVRLVALGALVAATILLVVGATLLLAGEQIGERFGLGPVWAALHQPLAAVLVIALLFFLYTVLPDRDQRGARGETLVGALVGTLAWLGATLLFQLYVSHFGNYSRTYGFVGGVILLMLWVELTAAAILLGGETASVLERRRLAGAQWPAVERRRKERRVQVERRQKAA